jgi:hypothetical protein
LSRAENFWSRRKAAVEAEELAVLDAREVAEIDAAQAEKTDDEILAELNLPDPDTLQPGDDFSGFMSRMVPDRIRRRALRKLWGTNPVLANVDGLVDYGEDFTDAALAVENLQTAYQVGKGMLTHVLKMEEEAKAKEAADEADEAEEVADQVQDSLDTEETIVDEVPDQVRDSEDMMAAAVPASTPDPREIVSEEPDLTPAPRRMQFSFEGDAA